MVEEIVVWLLTLRRPALGRTAAKQPGVVNLAPGVADFYASVYPVSRGSEQAGRFRRMPRENMMDGLKCLAGEEREAFSTEVRQSCRHCRFASSPSTPGAGTTNCTVCSTLTRSAAASG
jgi:hypothetical protein